MDGVAEQLDFSVVSPALTIEALRDSGYKDTDHAIAELIDNSIEANAELVELIACEVPADPMTPYSRARVNQIAVVDDGDGMDPVTLRRALRFGDGTRLDRRSRGIGRFGVGLPNASISQCRRVDIWTWRNGPDNAMRCHLDLEAVRAGEGDIPEPVPEPVPDRWRTVSEAVASPSGTLVVWSQLDRVRWRGGEKTLQRTADLCGRVYRKFLSGSRQPIEILLKLARENGEEMELVGEPRLCPPNDPLYLMDISSTPPPFADKPMFQIFNKRNWTIQVSGPEGEVVEGEVQVRCSLAKPDAINEKKSAIPWPKSYPKAGDAPWGKHADRNKGVSIVRAGRELELSQSWVNSYEPEERWWSVEVEFDPILDEIFGVVNNKQHAHVFVSGADFKWEEAADPGETLATFRERLIETSDPRGYLLEIWDWIYDQISRMRAERRAIMKGTGSETKSRHPTTGETVEDVATNVIKDQGEQGVKGSTDNAPETSDEQKIAEIAESARQVRVEPETAKEWAIETVRSGRRVLMKGATLGHDHAFFDVESVNDVIEVWINNKHPVYSHLIEVLDDETTDQSLQEVVDRLEKASFTLRMIMIAWARYEDKTPTDLKMTLEDLRMDWGREARDFLRTIE
ncbi:MAG: ATP-binding protein [Acidimicrobiaceae bacterium]|nr:ATP-binding protein [Acidimicrobiaceae bacterium]